MSGLIQRLLPLDDLFATVRRFPLSVLCAVSLFVIGFLMVHRVLQGVDEELIARLCFILGGLYFWFGVTKLASEAQKLSFTSQSLLNLVGGVALILLVGTAALWWIHLFFVFPALLLALMFAPYMTSGNDTSFWFFNRQMWFGVVVSYAALFLFAGGLSVGFFAIQALFGINLPEEILADIWLFASLILGPVYALSWVPKQFEFSSEDCSDPPGLQFIANWISAPMIFLYMGILYAYFGKIITTGEVPDGQLAILISGFIGAGLVTYLVAWPMRESGSPQLRAFYKIFFYAMIIPVGFHFYAIWERISSYGITEQRYVLLLSAIWFATIAIGNVITRMPIKVIPASLCVLLVFASFGPWGAVSLSGHSQYSRLVKVMEENQLLVDGRVVAVKDVISLEDRISISSILQYLCRSERDAMVVALFNREDKHCSAYDLTKELGFDYVHHRYNDRIYNTHNRNDDGLTRFNRNKKHDRNAFIDIQNYDVMIKRLSVKAVWDLNKEVYKSWSRELTLDNGHLVRMSYDMPELLILITSEGKVLADARVDLNAYADQNVSMIEKNDVLPHIVLDNDQAVLRLDVQSLTGKIKEDDHLVTHMNFGFLYRIKE